MVKRDEGQGVLKFNAPDWTSILRDSRFKIQGSREKFPRDLESRVPKYWSSIRGIELQYWGPWIQDPRETFPWNLESWILNPGVLKFNAPDWSSILPGFKIQDSRFPGKVHPGSWIQGPEVLNFNPGYWTSILGTLDSRSRGNFSLEPWILNLESRSIEVQCSGLKFNTPGFKIQDLKFLGKSFPGILNPGSRVWSSIQSLRAFRRLSLIPWRGYLYRV